MEEQVSIKSLIIQYLEIAWRRKWCALPFPFLCAIAIYYAASLPPIYQSKGVLLVEDQNIPQELIRTTVTSYAAEQMQVIRQQIESTENVLSVILKYGLYKDAVGATDGQLAQRFRQNMGVDTIDVNVLDPSAGRRRVISIAFRISFQDESPQLAQSVTEELVELFLEKNTITRKQEAEQTFTFLREEANDVQRQLQEIEKRISVFKGENGDSLPELLQYNLDVIATAEQRLRENQITFGNLTEQEQLLSIELRSMDPYTGAPIGAPTQAASGGLTPAAQLAQRRSELAQLSTRYSASHPSIISVKRDIEILEQQVENERSDPSSSEEDESLYSPAFLSLRYRVESMERDISGLENENVNLRQQIVDFNQRVEKTYIVEREYEELLRERNAYSVRYDQLRDAQYEAEVAQSLEEKNQVEGLTVIEQPNLPTFPIGPERFKVVVLGAGLAGALCLGLALLLEFLDERVRGARGYRQILGQPPLVSLPVISTHEEVYRQKTNRARVLKYSVMACVLLIAISVIAYLLWVR